MATLFQDLVCEEEVRWPPWGTGGEWHNVNAETKQNEYHGGYLAADGLDPM